MADYQLTANDVSVIRTADGTFIPNSEDNPSWQEYQAWLAAGNTPDPYVPPPQPEPPPPELVAWSDQYETESGAVTGVSGLGQIGFDNADVTQASQVFMTKNNAADSDVSTVFAVAAQPDRVLRIEDRRDAMNYVEYRIESTEFRADDFVIYVTQRNVSQRALPPTVTAVSVAVFKVAADSTKSIRDLIKQ